MKEDLIRKRLNKGKFRQKEIDGCDEEAENLGGIDKNIPLHMNINGDYVYEMGLEMTVASTMKVDGYFYVYQTYNTLESKLETPTSSNLNIFSFDEDK